MQAAIVLLPLWSPDYTPRVGTLLISSLPACLLEVHLCAATMLQATLHPFRQHTLSSRMLSFSQLPAGLVLCTRPTGQALRMQHACAHALAGGA